MERDILFLHILLLIYSTGGIFAKCAAGEMFFSQGFVFCYGGLLIVMGVYALGWQKIISRMPLSMAYAHRAVTVIWGVVWGCLIFGERLTIKNLVGAALITVGIVVYAMSRGNTEYE